MVDTFTGAFCKVKSPIYSVELFLLSHSIHFSKTTDILKVRPHDGLCRSLGWFYCELSSYFSTRHFGLYFFKFFTVIYVLVENVLYDNCGSR